MDVLGWIAAVGGVAATAGAWRSEAAARWQARAERLRTDAARRENELHRARFAEVWNWQRSEPEGDARIKAIHWYSEWVGNYEPYRAALDSGPLTPGLHTASEDEAYRNYVDFLEAVYQPGRLGPPRQPWHRQLPG